MSYTITANLNLSLNAVEAADTTTSPSSGTQGAQRIFDALAKSLNFGAATYPPVNFRVVDLYTLLAGATADLDLTAIPTAADLTKTVDLTGKKVVAGAFWAPKANAATIRIAAGAATPYHLFGTATDGWTLPRGKRFAFGLDGELDTAFTNGNQAVAAANKLIRLTGTAGDKLYGVLLFG